MNANNTLEAKKLEATKILNELIQKVSNFGSNEQINWSHVGSMSHVLLELENINEFLGN